MTGRPAIIAFLSGLCAVGFLVGAAAKQLREAPPEPAAADAKSAIRRPEPRVGGISLPHSTDTAATLPTPDGPDGYSRIALWLLDADAREIAKYWESVKTPWPGIELVELVFAHWTRLDPHGAIAAEKGGRFANHAWNGWACNDPTAALAAAIAGDPKAPPTLAWAIGRYHPDWLRTHFDEIPADMQAAALDGLANQAATGDPLATLDFLQTKGQFNRELFQALVRQDPWSALDRLQQNAADPFLFSRRREALADLAECVAESQPEALARMIEETPPGALKRGLEAAGFASLLKADPQAALVAARATSAPRVAAERLVAVGRTMVESDPATARELAAEIFSLLPRALENSHQVITESAITSFNDPIDGIMGFLTPLLRDDPAAAAEWLESADMPESARKRVAAWLQKSQNP